MYVQRLKKGEYPPQVAMAESEALDLQGRTACDLLQETLRTYVPDGVDGAGRQKCRLITPQEAVERADEAAARIHREFLERGWVTILPNPFEPEEVQHETP